MRRLHTFSGFVIVTVWATAFGDWVVSNNSSGLDDVTPIMFVFAGYMFGDSLLRRRYLENSDGD